MSEGQAELERLRIELKLNKAELARQLRTPYRTVQDWLIGVNPVPGVAIVAAELLLQKDKWVMAQILAEVDRVDLS